VPDQGADLVAKVTFRKLAGCTGEVIEDAQRFSVREVRRKTGWTAGRRRGRQRRRLRDWSSSAPSASRPIRLGQGFVQVLLASARKTITINSLFSRPNGRRARGSSALARSWARRARVVSGEVLTPGEIRQSLHDARSWPGVSMADS